MDCNLPGSYDHGILQARILERVAMPFSREILPTQGLNLCLQCLLHCWQFLDSLSDLGSLTSILLNFFLCSWYLFSSVYWALTGCPIVTSKSKFPFLNWLYSPCLSTWSMAPWLGSSVDSSFLLSSLSTNYRICWVYIQSVSSGCSTTHSFCCLVNPDHLNSYMLHNHHAS